MLQRPEPLASAVGPTLRVLIVEDRPADAELMVRELQRAGFTPEWTRVETEPGYLALLDHGWDLILADYALPEFDGLRALDLLTERALDIPFIIVSGSIGEEVAVTAMKRGAHDYVHKDRLRRLGPAAARELREAAERAARRGAEAALRGSEALHRTLVESATDAIITVGADLRVRSFNAAAVRIFGYDVDEVVGGDLGKIIPADYGDRHSRGVKAYLDTAQSKVFNRVVELTGLRKGGAVFPMEMAVSETVVGTDRMFTAIIRDVTERRRAEEQIKAQLHELQRWQRVTLDREGRVLELKCEVNELLARLGAPARYAVHVGTIQSTPPAPLSGVQPRAADADPTEKADP